MASSLDPPISEDASARAPTVTPRGRSRWSTISNWYGHFDRWVVRGLLLPLSFLLAGAVAGLRFCSQLDASGQAISLEALLGALLFNVFFVFFYLIGTSRRESAAPVKTVLKRLLPLATCILVVVLGVVTGLYLYEGLASGVLRESEVAFAIFVLSLIIVLAFLIPELSNGKKREGAIVAAIGKLILPWLFILCAWVVWYALTPSWTEVSALLVKLNPVVLFTVAVAIAAVIALAFVVLEHTFRYSVAVFVATLTVVSITFNLAPEISTGLKPYLGQLLDWLLSQKIGLSLSGERVAESAPGSDAIQEGIGLILSVLSAGTLTATASTHVIRIISDIQVAQNLTEEQRRAAARLRHAASSAVPAAKRLTESYPQEFRIDLHSKERRFPLINTGGTKKARVKLIIQPGNKPETRQKIDAEWLGKLLTSARGVPHQTLFFVCTAAAGQDPEVVCYGTGAEFVELASNNGVVSSSGSPANDTFFDALNDGDAAAIKRVVDEVRGNLLQQQPYRDLLLATITQKKSRELAVVLKDMGQNRLGHILLVTREGLEDSLLGAEEIAAYLLMP